MAEPGKIEVCSAVNVVALMSLLQEGAITRKEYLSATLVTEAELNDFISFIEAVKRAILIRIEAKRVDPERN